MAKSVLEGTDQQMLRDGIYSATRGNIPGNGSSQKKMDNNPLSISNGFYKGKTSGSGSNKISDNPLGLSNGLLSGKGLGTKGDVISAARANSNNPIGYKGAVLSKKSKAVGGK